MILKNKIVLKTTHDVLLFLFEALGFLLFVLGVLILVGLFIVGLFDNLKP